MRIWIALIVAPTLALTDLTVAFATVTPSCAHQLPFVIHVVHGIFFVATLMCALAAWSTWRAPVNETTNIETPAQVHFLAGIATAAAALSAIAILAMWMPVPLIATCIS
jgi:hypothetical protein